MSIIKFIRYIFFAVHIICMAYGAITFAPNICLIGITFLFLQNCIWAIENIKYRTAYLFFHLVLFVFIIGRPIYQLKEGEQWFFYGEDELRFTLVSIWITLFCLFIGGQLITYLYSIKKERELEICKLNNEKQIKVYSIMRKFVFVSYIFTLAINMIIGMEQIRFAQNHQYAEYYISFSSNVQYFTGALSSLMPYALCVYLALRPNKNMSIFVLGTYILSAIPNLVVGARNPIILNIMFAICYFWIRNTLDEKERWIGKKEIVIVFTILPLLAVVMYLYAYIRADIEIPKIGLNILWGFIYQQGTTFDVLSLGYQSLPLLPNNHHYILGGIIDYYTHGSIAQNFFGEIDLGGSNSAIMGLESNNFAHNMSYVMHPDYLNGQGWGTSYILEVFADYGYIGIAVYSILLAIFLLSIVKICKRNYYCFTIVLIVLTNIFLLPRDSALGCFNPILEVPFILVLVACIFFEKLLYRIVDILNIKKRRSTEA